MKGFPYLCYADIGVFDGPVRQDIDLLFTNNEAMINDPEIKQVMK